MDTDELFNALRTERTASGRERLVTNAISLGVDIDEIRDMLDYLEVHAKELAEPAPAKGLPSNLSIQPRTS